MEHQVQQVHQVLAEVVEHQVLQEVVEHQVLQVLAEVVEHQVLQVLQGSSGVDGSSGSSATSGTAGSSGTQGSSGSSGTSGESGSSGEHQVLQVHQEHQVNPIVLNISFVSLDTICGLTGIVEFNGNSPSNTTTVTVNKTAFANPDVAIGEYLTGCTADRGTLYLTPLSNPDKAMQFKFDEVTVNGNDVELVQ